MSEAIRLLLELEQVGLGREQEKLPAVPGGVVEVPHQRVLLDRAHQVSPSGDRQVGLRLGQESGAGLYGRESDHPPLVGHAELGTRLDQLPLVFQRDRAESLETVTVR